MASLQRFRLSHCVARSAAAPLLLLLALGACSEEPSIDLHLQGLPGDLVSLRIQLITDAGPLPARSQDGRREQITLFQVPRNGGQVTVTVSGLNANGCRIATGEGRAAAAAPATRLDVALSPAPGCQLLIEQDEALGAGVGQLLLDPPSPVGTCAPPCLLQYSTPGAAPSLAAVPDAASRFAGWLAISRDSSVGAAPPRCRGAGPCVVAVDEGVTRVRLGFAPRRLCHDDWCYDNPLPQGHTLEATWGTADGEGWAVGASGTVLRRLGGAFVLYRSGTTAHLRGVWGSGPDDVWLVGDRPSASGSGEGTVLRWDGTALREVHDEALVGQNINGVWGSAPNDVWLAGTAGPIHFDGQAFVRRGCTPACPATALWGTSATDLWAALAGGDLAHWDGASWQRQRGASASLWSLWGSGPDDIYAAGGSSLLHYNGTRWSAQASELLANASLNGVSGSGPDDVWAVGTFGLLLHWDGKRWRRADAGHGGSLTSVFARTAQDAWTAGGGGILSHWNGLSWLPESGSISGSLNRVWGAGPEDVWAVGPGVVRWNGEQWLPVYATAGTLWDVFGFGQRGVASEVVAVGNAGTVLRFSGGLLVDILRSGGLPLFGVWGSGPERLWFVGGQGTILRGALVPGFNIVDESIPARHVLQAVWGSGPDDVWVVGWSAANAGVVLHRQGGVFQEEPITSGPLWAVWGSGPDDVWVAGESGVLRRTNGAFAQVSAGLPANAVFTGLWGSAANDVFVTSSKGLYHYDGTRWTPVQGTGAGAPLGGDSLLRALWGQGQHVFAVGTSGVVLHRRPGAPR